MDGCLMFGILCVDCRGDKSFCSVECRENFMIDYEMEEAYHPASPRSPPSDGGRIFQLIRWVSISNNSIWSYLKCCLRLISCSHGCDHVCSSCCPEILFVAALMNLPHLLISFVLRTWILEFLEESKKWLPPVIILSWSEMSVCVCVLASQLELFAWTAFSVAHSYVDASY